MGKTYGDSTDGKQYWTIVSGEEKAPVNATSDLELAYLHRSRDDLAAVVMVISDDFLRADVRTRDPIVL